MLIKSQFSFVSLFHFSADAHRTNFLVLFPIQQNPHIINDMIFQMNQFTAWFTVFKHSLEIHQQLQMIDSHLFMVTFKVSLENRTSMTS